MCDGYIFRTRGEIEGEKRPRETELDSGLECIGRRSEPIHCTLIVSRFIAT